MRAQSGSFNFTAGNQSATTPIASSNILWGAAASAMLGASLAEWQRKREEESARLAASRGGGGGEEEEGPGKKKSPGRTAYEKMMQQKRIVGELQNKLNEKAREKAAEKAAEKARLIARNEDRAPIDMAKVNALLAAQSAREKLIARNEDQAPVDMAKVEQIAQNAVYAARWAGVASAWQGREEEKESGGKPFYTLSSQEGDRSHSGTHNFPRKPVPINLNDPRYDFNNPENWNQKYWNLDGIKLRAGWISLYQGQKSLEIGKPLPAPFTNYVYPETSCTNFTSAGGYLAGNPFFSDPSAPFFYRTSENQYLYSLQNGEIRYRLNPAILATNLQEPFQTNQAIFDLYQANPGAFAPGSIAYTKTGDLRSNGALRVNPTLLEWYFPNSFGHSFGIMSNGEAPVVAEMSGPWRYTPGADGRYIGNLKPGEVEAGNYTWEITPDRIEMRPLFDFTYPWQTTVHGNPNGDYIEFHILTELSVVPAQPITPDNMHLHGINYELTDNNKSLVTDHLWNSGTDVDKECYINPATQDNLIQELYCPPAGTPISNSTP